MMCQRKGLVLSEPKQLAWGGSAALLLILDHPQAQRHLLLFRVAFTVTWRSHSDSSLHANVCPSQSLLLPTHPLPPAYHQGTSALQHVLFFQLWRTAVLGDCSTSTRSGIFDRGISWSLSWSCVCYVQCSPSIFKELPFPFKGPVKILRYFFMLAKHLTLFEWDDCHFVCAVVPRC